jgi:uncharacterized oxidoreductase
MKLTNNKILITGGGSGIGLGFTKRFAQLNNQVIICGRREDVLKKVAQETPNVSYKVCNLTEESERIALLDWVKNTHPDLNVLLNNAGIQQWMNISDDNFYKRAHEEIVTNVEAPIHLTSLFAKLPSIKTIMNVTSGLAFAPMAKVPVYCATKAFFRSFTLSARHLLKEKGIEVIEVIPPALNTDLGGKGIHDFAPPVSEFIESIFKQLEEGKTEVTFGSSASRANASQEELRTAFVQMNSR